MTWRRVWPWLARLAVVGLLAFWIVRYADLHALGAALGSIPPAALAVAGLIGAANVLVGVWRWRVMMAAFGAQNLPGWWTVARVNLVGMFYNTFVPGSVGGDLVRGFATRGLFEQAATGFVVVFLERFIGLSCLVLVFLVGFAFGPPLVDMARVWPWLLLLAGLGVVAVGVALAGGHLRRFWARVPRVHRPLGLLAAVGLSLVGHTGSIYILYLLARGMDLPLGLGELTLAVPLMLIAAVVPIAVAGMGPREVALVGILGVLGVDKERALALSLGYAAILLSLSLLGGLIHLLQPRLLRYQ